ncbi:substrate-binding domain-containing protein [Paenibacillus hamazuiensis]|uniref:substrate-binding domain-containing protein n=1 Tax=Paenibacillus hamazuiensis TaxID=2936508 RepID=UPI00200CC8FB|nr:substrate-binding domain-containing protein [Paenibacillus hamazuiensis]
MVRKAVFWIAVAAAIVLIFAVSGAISDKLAEKSRPILVVPKTNDTRIAFWHALNEGVMAAAKEYGVDVEVRGMREEADIDGQIRLLEQAIAEKPQAIVLAASDYNRLVPVAQSIVNAGIKLITVDSGLSGNISSSFIATDNYEAGKKAGFAMRSLVPPGASVAIVSFVKESTTAMERERGVRDSLSEGGIRIVSTSYSNGLTDKASEITEGLIRSEPNLHGIIGLNEVSTIGALQAVKRLNAGGTIKMVGFDSSPEEIASLEEGILQVIVVQKPFNMGYLAVKTAFEAISGKRVTGYIDTGSEVITKENMYTNENQKLLFPFVGEK